jgi:dipeptidyl aminopeptidase/acylaminoacyl peptidase
LLLLSQGAAHCRDRPAAKTGLDKLLDSLFRVRAYKEVALAPDGKRVAWVEALPGEEHAASSHSAIYVSSLDAADKPRRITAGTADAFHQEHDVGWSPDGSKIVFLSDKEKKGQPQVYLAAVATGAVKKLTGVNGPLAQPGWSPDGKLLAVLFAENAPQPLGPLGPAAPDAGVVERHVYTQRLCTIDPGIGRVLPLTPAGLHVYEYDWSPDGKNLVAIAAQGSGDNNWYIAQLYTVAAASGTTKSILKPGVQIAVPRWSPDGKSIAFIGGLMSDEGAIGGDIYTVPAVGGKPSNLTPGRKSSPAWLAWKPDSRGLLFTEHFGGASRIASLDLATGRAATVWTGAETITARGWSVSLSLSGDQSTSALVRHSFERPPEVWAGPVGKWKQITRSNAGQRPGWGKTANLRWKSDEFTVQGWLLYPKDYDARRRYPLAVSVHGGPAWAVKPSWPQPGFGAAILSAEGYFVLYPNPRGSYGQGEAFTRANVKDFGHGDLRDILAGVNRVVKTLPIDESRLGMLGWSYGGYMTMWAVTQTTRFRAAVAGAGVANWQSYYGQNGIDQWLIPYFGASVYDDPAVYARSSPINFIKKVRTPTLVLVGDRDVECPAPQSYEFWRALKRLDVPTQLVVYPNEGHRIAKPQHRRDIARRTVGWLNKYLRNKEEGKQKP